MGRYSKYKERSATERRWNIHPIWRGIGCLLLILVPTLSYMTTVLISQINQKSQFYVIPPELAKPVDISSVLRFFPGLYPVVMWLRQIYYMDVLMTFTFMVIGFGILTVLYSTLYRAIGPSRWGPLDSPPVGRAYRRARR